MDDSEIQDQEDHQNQIQLDFKESDCSPGPLTGLGRHFCCVCVSAVTTLVVMGFHLLDTNMWCDCERFQTSTWKQTDDKNRGMCLEGSWILTLVGNQWGSFWDWEDLLDIDGVFALIHHVSLHLRDPMGITHCNTSRILSSSLLYLIRLGRRTSLTCVPRAVVG